MAVCFRAMRGAMQLTKKYRMFHSRNVNFGTKFQQTQTILNIKQEEDPLKMEMPDPLASHDFFEVRNLFTIKQLFNARVHLGHTKGTLNEHMKQFIIGERLGTLVFDLDQTAELLSDALNFIAHIVFRGGIVMFVARYKQNSYLIEKTALECGEYCFTREWRNGVFTDSNRFGMMTRLPDLVIFLNTLDSVLHTHLGVVESNKLLIPTVGIVDTNCFPNYITYPVPGNDDTPDAVELYCRLFKEAVLKGKAKRKELIEKYCIESVEENK